jgi:hypothetical protein
MAEIDIVRTSPFNIPPLTTVRRVNCSVKGVLTDGRGGWRERGFTETLAGASTRVLDGLEAEDAAAFAENERLGLHR